MDTPSPSPPEENHGSRRSPEYPLENAPPKHDLPHMLIEEQDEPIDLHASFAAAFAEEDEDGTSGADPDPAEDDNDLDESDDADNGADDGDDSDEDDDADGTDDTDDDAEDDEDAEAASTDSYLIFDEAEGREVFLRAEDPETGESSVYLTREDAAAGLQKQLQFIGQMKAQTVADKAAAQTALADVQAELDLYQRTTGLDPAAALEAAITARLPEALRNLDPKTLTGDDYDAYSRARIDARNEIKSETEASTKERIARVRDAAAATEAAEAHVGSRKRDYTFLGIQNAEDRLAFDALVAKPAPIKGAADTEMTPLQVAGLLAKEISPEAADSYLRGLSDDFRKSSKATVAKKAQKVRTVAKPAPKAATGASRKKTSGGVNTDPMTTFAAAFEAEKG